MGREIDNPPAPPKPGGGSIVRFIVPAVLILAAAGGGALTYMLVLAPMLAPPPPAGETPEAVGVDDDDDIPLNPVTVGFDEQTINLMRENDLPASLLMYKVTLECSNPETAAVIEANKSRFLDKIQKPHLSRTRAELDDVKALQESNARVIKQQCNDLLRRLQEDASEENRVTAIFYDKFTVVDSS